MEQGALGLSTSLQYVPDRFASTDEIVELAKVAAQYGGVYFTHQRSESARIFESLDEVFAIAERANIPAEDLAPEDRVQSEFRQDAGGARSGSKRRARAASTSPRTSIRTARASNGLDACLPLWVREGGLDKMLARLDAIRRSASASSKDMDDATRDHLGEPVVRRRTAATA